MAVRGERFRVSDGFTSLERGVDSGLSPNAIQDTQCAFSINTTFRDGFPVTRPGFVYRALEFDNTEEEDWFQTHNIQAARVYNPFSGLGSVIALVGGRLFRINVETDYVVMEITPVASTTTTANFVAPALGAQVTIDVADNSKIFTGYPVKINGYVYTVDSKSLLTITATNVNDPTAGVVTSGIAVVYLDPNTEELELAHITQGEEFLVVQDGQSKPIYYNGAASRRASNPDDLPVGSVMAYGLGRFWVARGREYVAGDIVNGDGPPTRGNILKFTENSYFAEGGAFALPLQSGGITGMLFTSNLDTSLGQGELMVGSRNGIALVNVPVDRDAWANLTYPVQRIAAQEFGPTAQDSMVLVNSDVFYRARDGVRSFVLARRDFGTWGNTPVSQEMGRVLDRDSQELLQFVSAVNFDNRLLMTVSPAGVQGGCYFRGLLALNFDLVSAMGRKSPPAYDGLWTGIQPVKIFKGELSGVDRCFVFHRNDSGENELWEVSKNEKFDTTPTGRRAIRSVVETKSFGFQGHNQLKRLQTADIFVDNLTGEVNFNVKYRANQYPGWVDWASWSETATFEDCGSGCRDLANYQPQYRARMRLPQPGDDCETGQTTLFRDGYEFQARIQWEGYARVKLFVMHADQRDEEPFGDCRVDGSAQTIDLCPDNPFESW